MTRHAKHALLWIAVLALVTTFVTAAAQRGQTDAADAEQLVKVLAIDAGDTVAEIGAGRGALTLAIARIVGPDGRMYASELGDRNIATLRGAVERSGLTQITVVEGHASRTNLPDACCDAIFMRDVYHHFSDAPLMTASLFQSLKPGGHLGIIDFRVRGEGSSRGNTRGEGGGHGADPDAVSAELKQAGFEVLSVENVRGRDFVVVARKPASASW